MRASLKWLAKQGFQVECVVDVGASDGRWSKTAMKSFPDARYVLFEPNPTHFRHLQSFAAKNSRTHVVSAAVADFQGTVNFDGRDPQGESY